MPQRPAPTATPWNGLTLSLVIGGGLSLSLVLAGTGLFAVGQRLKPAVAAETGEAPAVAVATDTVLETVPAQAQAPTPIPTATAQAPEPAPATTPPKLSFVITPMPPAEASATAEPEPQLVLADPQTDDAESTGGLLQHHAADVQTQITVSRDDDAAPSAAPAPTTAAGQTTSTSGGSAPAPVVRAGLARPSAGASAAASADAGASAGASASAGSPAADTLASTFEIQHDETPSSPTAEERFQQDVQRFISFYNIGWSTNSPAHRNIGWNVATRGWPTFVRFHIEPQIEQGVRRFQLHNPFGAIADEAMQLDQLIHAQEAGLLPVTTNFVEAWKPITDQGIEVIAYVGCGTDDPDFRGLTIDQWLERAFRSVQPCLDANMSIALDAAVGAAEGSPTHVFALRLRERGVRVYVEAKPTRTTPHWFDFDVMALDQTWLNSDIEHGHPQARTRYGISDDLLTGEIVRMIRPRTNETQEDLDRFPVIHGRIRDILDDGHAVSMGAYHWFKQGRTLRDLLYVDERQAAYD